MPQATGKVMDKQIGFAVATVDSESTYDSATKTIKFRWLTRSDHVRGDIIGEPAILRLHPEGCDLSKANAGGPFKFLHEVKGQVSVIGNVDPQSMTLDSACNGYGAARLIDFAEDESDADEDKRAAMKVAKRYIRPVSFDGTIKKIAVETSDDPSALPIVHALEWEVWGVSSVMNGQDPGALTMGAQLEDNAMAAPQPDTKAPATSPMPDPAALAAATDAGTAAAFERFAECKEIGVVFGLDDKAVLALAKGKEPIADISKRLIKERADKGDALKVASHVNMGVDERDTIKAAIVEGIEARLGHTEPTERGRRFVHVSMEMLARQYLAAMNFADVTFDPMTESAPMVVRRALGFGVFGGLAPSDLPVLLTQGSQRVLNRIAAAAPPMEWLQLCRTRSCNDFREIQLVSRTFAGDVKEIPVNGPPEKPFTHGETYEVGAVKQWGARDDIGRIAQINDDLGSLDDLPQDILQAFREHMYSRFWSVFLTGTLRDGQTVCHATHNNVVASGGAGPGTLAQLAKMRKLFAAATHGGRNLRLRMTHLITPLALRDEAWQVVSGQINPTQADKGIPPDYRSLTVLSDIALDTDSEVKWYAASAMFPCFHYLTLRGADVPQISAKQNDDTRALEIRAFHDYNIVPSGYQGIAYNKGAA